MLPLRSWRTTLLVAVMTFTRHGHDIPGSPWSGDVHRPPIARCGGIPICPFCKADAAEYDKNYPGATGRRDPLVIVADDVDAPLAFVTDNDGAPNQYIDKARQLVVEVYNRNIADLNHHSPISDNEVYVVWFSKVLQNWKALVSTDRSDARYYEVTYNGDKEEAYVDTYIKARNDVVKDSDRDD